VAVLGRRGAIALTCAAALAMPAAALANAYDDTLKEYRTTGAVNGCGYTAAKLAQAKAQTPKNIKDVAPGYPAQLAVAAAKRAKGCTKAEEQAATTAAAAAAGTTATGATGTGSTGAGATTAPGATTATQPPATTTIAPNATTAAATPAPARAPAPAAATQTAAQSTSSHKGARLALIVVGALLLMLLALWAFARWWAWEPHWLARWRHATAEAGWRASAAWAEFTDWLRLGR
jgi:cobalamin biosynthesis Mg chelatase CobN